MSQKEAIHILILYFICNLCHECDTTLFKLRFMEKINTKDRAVCKLLKYENITLEITCGKRCKLDNKCVYFKYKASLQECFLCTVGDITHLTEYTAMSSKLYTFEDLFERVNFCNQSGECQAKDCSEYRSQGFVVSGTYDIVTKSGKSIQVYCDMEIDGGGWTVFQRRVDGSENFHRTWTEYENGFGNLNKEFWLGNVNISDITSQGSYQMRVEMNDFDWTFVYAAYNQFTINANDDYRMNYISYHGNIGDSLAFHKGQKFTTKDKDNDKSTSANCAVSHVGAWWYNACHRSNLNGLYLNGANSAHGDGVTWNLFRGQLYSLQFTEMKLRPSNYKQSYDLNIFNKEFPPARDCADHRDRGAAENGIYSVTTTGRTKGTFSVYCDMKTAGGGWMVFQRRMDGSVEFQRTYNEYQEGFGNFSTEFWLGNDNISSITEQGSYELRVDLADFDNVNVYASYAAFSLNRNDKYRLRLSTYTGNAGDSLLSSNTANGQKWTTKDSDNDSTNSKNCALAYKGAWWYNACHQANLNGLYLAGSHSTNAVGVNWHSFRGHTYSLRVTEMKLRPSGYKAPEFHSSEYNSKHPPRDCADIQYKGYTKSGIYSITTTGEVSGTFDVYCDMETEGGGWIVFQRRMDGSVDFQRTYNEYQKGFGKLSSEFWLGNDNLSSITEQGSYEMRVDLEDFDNIKKYANYGTFSINRNDKYRLRIGIYSGNAGNDMASGDNDANGEKWTTFDEDNDSYGSANCAVLFKGAWWYAGCHNVNLNGLYLNGSHTERAVGVNWHSFRGHYYSLKFTEMKIRPAGYVTPV